MMFQQVLFASLTFMLKLKNPNSPYSGVISIVMDSYKRLLANQEVTFNIFGDGKQSRDFVFVEDVVQALNLVAHSDQSLGKCIMLGLGKQPI